MFDECLADIDKVLAVRDAKSLFTEDSYASQYRALVKKCHPDLVPGKEDAFQKLSKLYKDAEGLVGHWGYAGVVSIKGTIYKYFSKSITETGFVYACENCVIYEIAEEYTSYISRIPRRFSYANSEMEHIVGHSLPVTTVVDNFVIVSKISSEYLLKDVANTTIPDKHIAWIVSRLYNTASYLMYADIVHGALNTDNIVISPENHSIIVAGGWLFSYTKDSVMDVLPKSTIDNVPKSVIYSKKATGQIMTSTIRAIGAKLKPTNPVLADFFSEGGKTDIVKEYALWQDKILVSAFGERKFTKWDITQKDIY